jgi:hypothetical protein
MRVIVRRLRVTLGRAVRPRGPLDDEAYAIWASEPRRPWVSLSLEGQHAAPVGSRSETSRSGCDPDPGRSGRQQAGGPGARADRRGRLAGIRIGNFGSVSLER